MPTEGGIDSGTVFVDLAEWAKLRSLEGGTQEAMKDIAANGKGAAGPSNSPAMHVVTLPADEVLVARAAAARVVRNAALLINAQNFGAAAAAIDRIPDVAGTTKATLRRSLSNAETARGVAIAAGVTNLTDFQLGRDAVLSMFVANQSAQVVTSFVDAVRDRIEVQLLAALPTGQPTGWKSLPFLLEKDVDPSSGMATSQTCREWQSVARMLCACPIGRGLADELFPRLFDRLIAQEPNPEQLPTAVGLSAYGHVANMLVSLEESLASAALSEGGADVALTHGATAMRAASAAAAKTLRWCSSTSTESLQCLAAAYRGTNGPMLSRLKAVHRAWADAVPSPIMAEVFYPLVVDSGLEPLATRCMSPEGMEFMQKFQRPLGELLQRVRAAAGQGVPMPTCQTLEALVAGAAA